MLTVLILLAMLSSDEFGVRDSAQRRLSTYPPRLFWDMEAEGSLDFRMRFDRLKRRKSHDRNRVS